MIRLTIPALPPSVNRRSAPDKELRAEWREIVSEAVLESLDPSGRYSFCYCVLGRFEDAGGKLLRRDHMNLEKPMIDDVSKALGVDDKVFVCKEGWKVHDDGPERIEIFIEECSERRPMWL